MQENEVPTRLQIATLIENQPRNTWESLLEQEWPDLPEDVMKKLVSDLDSYGSE